MSSGIVETSSQDNEAGQGQQGQRSKLVQRLLDAAPNLPAFIHDLLTTQAITVAGTEAAGFLIERQDDKIGLRNVAHIRPDDSTADMRAAAISAFTEIIGPCVQQGKDGAIEVAGATPDNIEPQYCLVTLLRSDNEIVAVSAVITRARNLERARQRLMSMQLVAGYFELYSLRRNSEQAQAIAQSHQHVLQLSTAVATAEGFESAAMNLCNELAARSGAVRVSLGWFKGNNIKVQALSHTEQFDKKQELIVQLQNVMEECADQEAMVLYDPNPDGPGSDNVTRAANKMSREQGGHIILSLPLRRQAEIVGVATLEFAPNQRLGPQVASGLSVAVDLLAPQLYDRFQNDRWLTTKVGLSARHVAEETLGPKHWLAKILTVVSLLLVGVLLNWIPLIDTRMTYKVTAPFQFVPIEKRTLSAPFDGFLKFINVKPGDAVTQGQVLAELDTVELRIKSAQAQYDAVAKQREADKYQADPTKIADRNIALAQKAEAEARRDLYDYQVQHAILTAPLDGEVLKGDLEDRPGTPVKQGEALFEIARRDNLKAELQVNERDIQNLKPGQLGYLATSSLPTDKHKFAVDRIVPLGVAREGGNIFQVYATLEDPVSQWRPGMMGEAKVRVDNRTIAWIWTHRLVDFVRLKLWI